MYTLIIENHKGEQLQLSQNPNYSITNISGLNPPTANINTAVNANFDGSIFKSSRTNERNIVIELAIGGNIEANRIALYQFIKSKRQCTLYFRNGMRNVSITGYVESFEIGLFDQTQMAQISILCPFPYFGDVEDSVFEFSSIEKLFEFPFSIEQSIEFSRLIIEQEIDVTNNGDVASGMIIKFHALGPCSNPTLYNVETNESIKVNVNMDEGDVVTINTNKGRKGVTLTSNGVATNIINNLDRASTWLQLESGDNMMLYTADAYPSNLTCTISFDDLYEGV